MLGSGSANLEEEELSSNPKPEKPLGHCAYGSIPHLPGSRRGPADNGFSEHQARILTEKGCNKHDTVIVQEKLEPSGHGAVDGVEGAVWSCEGKGAVDFLGKFVRPDKVDGKYLENISGGKPIYNWLPVSID